MDKKPVLSISLLSSGRIDTIERCLSSLEPLKREISTEIVIVDTDPKKREDVHTILEKYADKIIPFEWCDDFSAARNAGVEACAGEWFFFVDDDEWIIDPKPLVDFLLSDESKKYHWANNPIRNFKNKELSYYSESWVSRLFRMGNGMRFVGRMHEYIRPIIGKPVNLDFPLGHTGYIYESVEEKRAHAKRNLNGLEILMKEEPNEVRWVYQAMGEYSDLGNMEQHKAMARKGYKLTKGAPGYKAALMRGVFAAALVRAAALESDWEACDREYRKFITGERLGRMSRAQMEMNEAQATFYLGKTDQAKKHCEKYLKSYKQMFGKPVENVNEYLSFQADTFDEYNKSLVISMLISIDLNEGNWDAFDRYFDEVEWGSMQFDPGRYVKKFLLLSFGQNYDDRLARMVCVFWKTDALRRIVQTFLRDGASQGAMELGNAGYWNLMRAVAEADVDEHIPWDVKIFWEDHKLSVYRRQEQAGSDGLGNSIVKDTRNRIRDLYTKMYEHNNPLILDPRLWKIGMRDGAVLDERIREIPFEQWQVCVDRFTEKVDVGFAKEMWDIMEDVYLGAEDEWCGYFRLKTAEKILAGENELRKKKEQESRERQSAVETEMREIIEKLEKKVEELIAAGMMDEAEKVMKEIQKYTSDEISGQPKNKAL